MQRQSKIEQLMINRLIICVDNNSICWFYHWLVVRNVWWGNQEILGEGNRHDTNSGGWCWWWRAVQGEHQARSTRRTTTTLPGCSTVAVLPTTTTVSVSLAQLLLVSCVRRTSYQCTVQSATLLVLVRGTWYSNHSISSWLDHSYLHMNYFYQVSTSKYIVHSTHSMCEVTISLLNKCLLTNVQIGGQGRVTLPLLGSSSTSRSHQQYSVNLKHSFVSNIMKNAQIGNSQVCDQYCDSLVLRCSHAAQPSALGRSESVVSQQ